MFILGTSTPGKNISCVDSNNSGFTTDSTVSNSITGVSGYNKTRPDIIWFLSCLWGYKLTAIWAPMEKKTRKKNWQRAVSETYVDDMVMVATGGWKS